ncbi:hypothetical protein [Flavobacterium nitrogenifigens]|uniref:hypothetical protein n=1 Tax=Flavobacterium nitrogenifigens TaxID=1617283 RepID=UPI0031ACD631
MTKERTCFIIMPISDNINYPSGHFNRVYEYIIKPACEIAGFTPIRADEVVTTNYIALDIIKRIIESDMAICDLSSQNANVMYELGIRQAFNKPVTFLKDNITKRVFDIQGFRDLEYDMTLRIDNVNMIKDQLAESLSQTFQNKDSEINSLVKLLSISPAELSENTKLSIESELILNQLSIINNRLDKIDNPSKNVDVVNPEKIVITKHIVPENAKLLTFEEVLKLNPGDSVFHERYGKGEVLSVESQKKADSRIEINFNPVGSKRFLVRFMLLYKL